MKKYILFFIHLVPLFVFSQVGINTEDPTAMLDINGNLRIRQIVTSDSSSDFGLVVDEDGIIKKSITEESQIKAYLSEDFITDDSQTLFKILNFDIIEDPSNNFDLTNSTFTPSYSGIYNIIITITATAMSTSTGDNIVYGLVDAETNKWIMRFSTPKNYIQDLGIDNSAGATNSFTGTASLTKGKSYYFGVTRNLKLLYRPTGNTGEGIGSYFSIELISIQ